MIVITPDIKTKYPRAFRAARKDRFTIKQLENDLFYCARKSEGHGRYLVVFAVRGNGSVAVACRNWAGERCKGVEWQGGCCAHIAAVILRATSKKSKSERPIAA